MINVDTVIFGGVHCLTGFGWLFQVRSNFVIRHISVLTEDMMSSGLVVVMSVDGTKSAAALAKTALPPAAACLAHLPRIASRLRQRRE